MSFVRTGILLVYVYCEAVHTGVPDVGADLSDTIDQFTGVSIFITLVAQNNPYRSEAPFMVRRQAMCTDFLFLNGSPGLTSM